VLVKIPQRVIQNCVGLAIFTVMRTGMWISGAGGSGVLIARKEDGSWSPPSGLLVHTLGVGFMAGIDIYDCVVVINNRSALEAFSKVRVSLGGEISVVAGPLGVGGILESEVTKDRRPVFSYVKSRGFYAGAQLDGTVIVERNDENARFYGQQLPIGEILKGNVRRIPQETRMLMQVLRDIDARTGVGRRAPMTMREPPPSDMEIQKMDEQMKMDDQMKIDEQVKMDEQMAICMEMQYAPPPTYEEVHSTNSLYSPPSPVQSQRQSESFTPQFPAEGSVMASVSSPPLPPRPSSLNGDSENSKLG
jgi:lipid-binding SYLF domain-containing protein